ncbi:MAG: hypothetical protein V7K15_29410 [Nostoc sp.]
MNLLIFNKRKGSGVRRDAINRVCTGVWSGGDEEVEINLFPMLNAQ